MAETSLKDILLSEKYQRLKGYHITQDDVLDLYVLYREFSLLEEKYHQMVLGRKEEAGNLVAKLKFLEGMIEIISTKIKTKKRQYEDSTRDLKDSSVENVYMLYKVLMTLASTEQTQYDVELFVFPAYDSIEHHGYRTSREYDGEITILAEKESLAKLKASIDGTHISKENILELYRQGYSMVLTGNDDYMTDYDLPNRHDLGIFHPIVFYLQDDELAKIVPAFLSFIEDNGPDFDGIKAEDLINAIRTKYIKTIKFNASPKTGTNV